MNQLESDDNLQQLPPPYRGLVVLITETGLRIGDACTLPFDPVLTDSAGWPCLRFVSSKMRAEQLVPLSARAVKAVRDQQRHIRDSHPDGSAWLFPSRSAPIPATGTPIASAPTVPMPQSLRLQGLGGWPARSRITGIDRRITEGTVPRVWDSRTRAGG